MENASVKKMFDYNLVVNGIFGRNRTVKFKSVKLARVDRDKPLTLNEVIPLARKAMAELKVKSGAIRIDEDPIELDGVFVSYMLFSGRTLYRSDKIGLSLLFKHANVDACMASNDHAKSRDIDRERCDFCGSVE